MATANPNSALARVSRPNNRAFQIRYKDPKTGTDTRISVGCRDESKAQKMLDDITAKLQLGIDPKESPDGIDGMSWSEFRDRFTKFKHLRGKADCEKKLDVCERHLKAKSLSEAVRPDKLAQCQSSMLKAKQKNGQPLSPRTVACYMRTLKAALRWAYDMGYVDTRCDFKILKVDEQAKGRPLTDTEFQSMLDACKEHRQRSYESWQFLLRGLKLSGLRLSEAMNLSYDIDGTIQPKRLKGGHIALDIPASRQKNRKRQVIPTIPEFAELLQSVPIDQRTGYVFNLTRERGPGITRNENYIKREITDIGSKAGIVVNDAGKYASAHDLRRTFGQNCADLGMSMIDLQAIMRHATIATTQRYYIKHDITQQAERIANTLSRSGTKSGTKHNSEGDTETADSDLDPQKT